MSSFLVLEALYGLMSTLSFLALSVYIFLIWRGEHARLQFMTGPSDRTNRKVLAFLILAAIGFLVCIYQGTKTMLFWMPTHLNGDGEFTSAASVIALIFTMVAGSILIEHIGSAHGNILSLEQMRERSVGLEKILGRSDSPIRLDDLKKEFQEQINALRDNKEHIIGDISAEAQRAESFRYLIWLIENQKSKLTALVQNALHEENREQEDRIGRETKHAEALKKQAEHARRFQDYRNAFEAAARGKQVEIVRSLENIQEGAEYLIDAALAAKCWQNLERAANFLLKLSDEDIEKGKKPSFSINGFFKACVGTSLIPPLTVMASYSGDSHGGHTELYVEIDGHKESHLSALRLETSLDALVEGLYIAFQLCKKGIYWHGLYGRDYSFLFTTDELIEVLLQQSNTPPKGDDMCKLDRPCGIRVSKRVGVFTVSCLAAYPNGSIVDLSAHIDGGRLVAEAEHSVLKSSSVVFY